MRIFNRIYYNVAFVRYSPILRLLFMCELITTTDTLLYACMCGMKRWICIINVLIYNLCPRTLFCCMKHEWEREGPCKNPYWDHILINMSQIFQCILLSYLVNVTIKKKNGSFRVKIFMKLPALVETREIYLIYYVAVLLMLLQRNAWIKQNFLY